MLAYVALCGWGLPLATGMAYLLLAAPLRLRRMAQAVAGSGGRADAAAVPFPRSAPRGPAPFVFDADTPWGWLEHRNGRFQGQRLALKRAVVTLGRGEENDIWLDDDLASRYHAELLFQQGRAYISDCQSLNGVFVNGRRIRGCAPLRSGDRLEIGRHRFLFELARPARPDAGQDDPLLQQLPRAARLRRDEAVGDLKEALPVTPPLAAPSPAAIRWEHVLLLCGTELAGRRFVCAAPLLTIGRDPGCELAIDDLSLAARHALLFSRPEGLYVQDLTGGRATTVNGEPLTAPRLLRSGDLLRLGGLPMQYLLQPVEQPLATAGPPASATPAPVEQPSAGGPHLLRLPMRPPLHPPDPLVQDGR